MATLSEPKIYLGIVMYVLWRRLTLGCKIRPIPAFGFEHLLPRHAT